MIAFFKRVNHWEILLSRTYQGYKIETLWIDGESYALKMVASTSFVTQLPSAIRPIEVQSVY